MMDGLLILGGIVCLLLAGEALIKGAIALAESWGLSPAVIGLTVVGFGTSMPELVTSLQASLAGAPAIAVGNVVGSNIANILLILGAAALLRPLILPHGGLSDILVMLAASAALALILLSEQIGRLAGLGLLAALGAYLWSALRRGDVPDAGVAPKLAMPAAVGLAAVGILGLSLGAALLVRGAVGIAGAMGVSEAVIGVTIVAVGTSLPELVASLAAARRSEGALAFGNVVGSNIFNILGILGITALVAPVPVDPAFARLDLWVMAAAALALLAVPVMGWRIGRLAGGVLLAGYAAYLVALV